MLYDSVQSLSVFVVVPTLATAAGLKVASKTLDYTLFRAAKEILYIPLSYAQKTMGNREPRTMVNRPTPE